MVGQITPKESTVVPKFGTRFRPLCTPLVSRKSSTTRGYESLRGQALERQRVRRDHVLQCFKEQCFGIPAVEPKAHLLKVG
jgi:hypothetical protein